MIHAGDLLENPITGERLLFRKTSSDTGGEAVVLETFVKPDGFVVATHVHYQEERFEILDGSVGFRLGEAVRRGSRREAYRPGEDPSPLLERGRGGSPFRVRGASGAAVRAAH